jgi:hypothetical protein
LIVYFSFHRLFFLLAAGHQPIYSTFPMSAFDNLSDDDLQTLVANAIGELCRRRFEAGRQAMRDSILRAAEAPSPAPASTPQRSLNLEMAPGSGRSIFRRAPRGSVGQAVDDVLRAEPGLSIIDIESRVEKLNPEISIKSVGNELRRLEGKKYKRDRPGGYQWFLVNDREGGETGAPAPAAEMQHEQKGGDES